VRIAVLASETLHWKRSGGKGGAWGSVIRHFGRASHSSAKTKKGEKRRGRGRLRGMCRSPYAYLILAPCPLSRKEKKGKKERKEKGKRKKPDEQRIRFQLPLIPERKKRGEGEGKGESGRIVGPDWSTSLLLGCAFRGRKKEEKGREKRGRNQGRRSTCARSSDEHQAIMRGRKEKRGRRGTVPQR